MRRPILIHTPDSARGGEFSVQRLHAERAPRSIALRNHKAALCRIYRETLRLRLAGAGSKHSGTRFAGEWWRSGFRRRLQPFRNRNGLLISSVPRLSRRFVTEREIELAGGVAGAKSVTSHRTSAYASGQLFSFSSSGTGRNAHRRRCRTLRHAWRPIPW